MNKGITHIIKQQWKHFVPSNLKVLGKINAVTLTITAFLIISCSKQENEGAPETQNSNLKPALSAFGYTLGSNGVAVTGTTIDGAAPFDTITVETLANGTVCSIQAIGIVPGYALGNSESNLVQVLTSKYGLRNQDPCPLPIPGERDYNFGTSNASAMLRVEPDDPEEGETSFDLEYTDQNLMEAYYDEMESNQDKADSKQRQELSNQL